MKNFALELALEQRRESPIMGGLSSRLLSRDFTRQARDLFHFLGQRRLRPKGVQKLY